MNKFFLLIYLIIFVLPAVAYDPAAEKLRPVSEKPVELEGVGLENKLGESLDLSLEFLNEEGETVTLGSLLSDDRPTVLSMVYYNCPSLCNYHLNGLNNTYKKMKWTAGKEFRVIAVSFNPTEKPSLAKAKKASYLNDYGHLEVADSWHFLTGKEENIKKLANQLGFQYKWIEGIKEFSHPAIAYVLTPKGKISRYLQGIDFPEQTMKLALLEASKGTIGTVVDQILLFCFRFDPTKNKYTIYAFNIMRAGAGLTVLMLSIFLIPMWWREKKKKSESKAS